MMYTPFKMKGNPMQRNFGVGSPIKSTHGEATVAVTKEAIAKSHKVGGKVVGKFLKKVTWPIGVLEAAYLASTDKSSDHPVEKIGKAAWDVTGGFAIDLMDLISSGVGGTPKKFPYPWDLRFSKEGRLIQAPGTEIRRSTLTE